MARVIALVATIPARRALCERLLGELSRQTQRPDGVFLRLDGYGDAPSPTTALPVVAESRSAEPSGPGARWLAALDGVPHQIDPDDVLVCVDDDALLAAAPRFVEALVQAVESSGGAAGAMGRDIAHKIALPSSRSRGQLIYSAGLGLTLRARHLFGLRELAAQVQASGGPDTLGLLGDDDAIVSAHLWKTGVPIAHAAVAGNVTTAPAARTSAQSVARAKQGERHDEQKRAIQRVTGWPFEPQRKGMPNAV